jgi:hypothetical protein
MILGDKPLIFEVVLSQLMCRSLAWRSPVEGSPPILGEVSPDQVKDGGKDHICKWFSHLTLFSH